MLTYYRNIFKTEGVVAPPSNVRNGTFHSAFNLGGSVNLTIEGRTFEAKTGGFGWSWQTGSTTADPGLTGDFATLTTTWARDTQNLNTPIFIPYGTGGHTYEIWYHAILQPGFSQTVSLRPHQTTATNYTAVLSNPGATNKYVLLGPYPFVKPMGDGHGDILPMAGNQGEFRICAIEVWRTAQ